MATTGTERIVEKLGAQLEQARAELERAATELDILLGELIGDLHKNLGRYLTENIRREIRKKPECLEALDAAALDAMRAEVAELAAAESGRIIDAVRNDAAWLNTDVVFLDMKTSIWKSIKTIEAPANKIIKKYGIAPLKIRNWSWLSPHLDTLANDHYPPAKRFYIEKKKHADYLETRFAEETRLAGALDKLDNF
jgi:hypothetical protein